jgi:hypothetical protein
MAYGFTEYLRRFRKYSVNPSGNSLDPRSYRPRMALKFWRSGYSQMSLMGMICL